jgi:phosphoglycolate phosphatase/pyrophosphatase PpaX
MNRPLRGVIFDFDGTLADTFPICIEAFRQAAEPFVGRLLSDQEIISTFGPSEEGAAERLTPGHGSECLRAFYEHYERLHACCREPFEGIRELLADLRSFDLRVGLVTAKGLKSLEISLAAIGLTGVFDHIETGCPHGACKPEGILKELAAFDLSQDEAVYVGDAPSDVKAAREAGVPIIAVTWAGGPRVAELLSLEPDYVFHEVAELEAWLGASR